MDEYTASFSWHSYGHFTHTTTKILADSSKQAYHKALEWFAIRYDGKLDEVKVYQALNKKAA